MQNHWYGHQQKSASRSIGTGAIVAQYYTQTIGYVYEHYSEMVRLSCYYSYKGMFLRKTLPLHTLL